MGRAEKPIRGDGPLADFARRLRAARADAGMPTYRSMQARANYSHAVLAQAAGGDKLPSWEVTKAYLQALTARGETDRFELARWETYHGEVERTLANLARKTGETTTVTPGGQVGGPSTRGRPVVAEHATPEQTLPRPETVRTYEDLTRELNILRITAESPSFRELAKASHWGASTLCEVFSGRRRPTIVMVRTLTHALYTHLERHGLPAEPTTGPSAGDLDFGLPHDGVDPDLLVPWTRAWTTAEYNRRRPDLHSRHRGLDNIVLLPEHQDTGPTADIIAELPVATAAVLLGQMDRAVSAALIADLPPGKSAAILSQMWTLSSKGDPDNAHPALVQLTAT
ncbi:hypothetical protein [Amycolatopsis regifaucium]|uniref:Uncharacterized protein n=1 Tax=Amycolatopsis regifaucium TaxID=546365 RepID=A0A154M4W0_9PSEU|nr:hypothetical protein [Amycolatopsis regifaucium]KZB79632.1 hypothetical protein AVL48_14545 [Amycolatopsis regifaucium]OKA10051.1 hypothetical protein ATP06_0206870 [Amycolatopsis regifaucium]SFI63319.1 hypothetical protein SAMN04489731_11211 [Amycolatopsis regifaucium]